MDRTISRCLELLAHDSALGGVIAVGSGVDISFSGARRIPAHGELRGYQTPWGWQPGLLDGEGVFTANLDLLPPESQALLAQRMDEGGCTLLASCQGAPWAHLADRVAFLVAGDAPRPARGRPLGRRAAVLAIAAAALRLGVVGHRAEALALRAAEAAATADGRRRLTEGDVAEAIALVLAPRAQKTPEPQGDDGESTPPEGAPAPDETAEAPPLPVPMLPLPPAPVALRPSLHGAVVGTVAGRRRRGTLNLTATMLAALPWQRLRQRPAGAPLAIRPGDLRWHLRRPRQGRLIIFAVDGSGSMGARRLGQAKGAVLQLLQQAYRKRDHVALIAAAGPEARLLLPPARAVEQARRHLIALPAGGRTPLASALLLARSLAALARRREGRESLLLLLTDGRANQPLPGGDRSTVREELKRASLALRAECGESILYGEPGPEALELARWLGGQLQPIGRIRMHKGEHR